MRKAQSCRRCTMRLRQQNNDAQLTLLASITLRINTLYRARIALRLCALAITLENTWNIHLTCSD